MDTREAVDLIAAAIPRRAGTWADIGAGEGTFTRALAQLLGPEGRIYAVDRDGRAVAALERWAVQEGVRVIPLTADFTQPLDLPGLEAGELDGMLLANTLHFVADAAAVLARLVARVRPGGSIVVVEYDGRSASRWVPYPIPPARLPVLAAAASLTPFTVTGTKASAFGGTIYVAVATRAGSG